MPCSASQAGRAREQATTVGEHHPDTGAGALVTDRGDLVLLADDRARAVRVGARAALARVAEHRTSERMVRAALDEVRDGEHVRLALARDGYHVHDGKLSGGQGTGLVEQHRVDPISPFERGGVAEHDAFARRRRRARRHHQRHRERQRAGGS